MSTVDRQAGDGFVPTHTGLVFQPDGMASSAAAPDTGSRQEVRPLSSAETLAARPSTSHAPSDSSLQKEKRKSFGGHDGNDNNPDRDLEKQETGRQDKEDSKDEKDKEEKDPNLIEWDGDDDKVRATPSCYYNIY